MSYRLGLWIPILAALVWTVSGTEYQYVAPTFFAPFNGNAKDLTGGLEDGTVFGAVADVGPYGVPGSGLYFDGVDDFVKFNLSSTPVFTRDYSIMFWFKTLESNSGCLVCFIVGETQSQVNEFFRVNDGTDLRIRHRQQDSTTQYTKDVEGVFSPNNWYLVAATYEGSTGYHRVYLNNVEVLRWQADYNGADFQTGFHLKIAKRQTGSNHKNKGVISCLQIYNSTFTQRELSKAETLCQPTYVALTPWPQPLGLWTLDSTYLLHDVSRRENTHDGAITGSTYYDLGRNFKPASSVEFRRDGPTYLDLDNSDGGLSALNSATFSAWIYMTHGSDFPIWQYEYGTEAAGTQNWAFHIWILNSKLYICIKASLCTDSTTPVVTGQWNHVALTYDFYNALITFFVNGEVTSVDYNSDAYQSVTNLASGLRIGKTFYDPDEHHNDFRISCLQFFDVNMNVEEILSLKDTCQEFYNMRNGNPSGSVLTYNFNSQSRCSSAKSPRAVLVDSAGQPIDCNLAPGFRSRDMESVVVDQLNPVYFSQAPVIADNSDFTLMFYIKLDEGADVTLGFEGGPKLRLSVTENGSVALNITLNAEHQQPDVFNDFHHLDLTNWVHVTLACGDVGDCYLFRNVTYMGRSYLKPAVGRLTNTSLFIDTQGSTVNLACLQLYKRRLAQTEIDTSASQCYRTGDNSRHPVPVGLWPLDTKFYQKEVTGRNLPIEFVIEDGCIWKNDSSPLEGFTKGSLFLNNSGNDEVRCTAQISRNPALDVRHSFTWMGYVKALPSETFYVHLFTFESPVWGMPIMLGQLDGSSPITHNRVFGLEMKSYEGQTRSPIEFDSWFLYALQCEFTTGICRRYVNNELVAEASLFIDAEIGTTNDVRIGAWESFQGRAEITCFQLYDEVLDVEQMKGVSKLCNYERSDGTYYVKPAPVPMGYTRIVTDSTLTLSAKTQLQCMVACSSSSDCLSFNYRMDQSTCELFPDMYDKYLDLNPFEETGDVYQEFLHPIIAHGY